MMTDDEKYIMYKDLLSRGYSKKEIGELLGYTGKTPASSLSKFIKRYEKAQVDDSSKKKKSIIMVFKKQKISLRL